MKLWFLTKKIIFQEVETICFEELMLNFVPKIYCIITHLDYVSEPHTTLTVKAFRRFPHCFHFSFLSYIQVHLCCIEAIDWLIC